MGSICCAKRDEPTYVGIRTKNVKQGDEPITNLKNLKCCVCDIAHNNPAKCKTCKDSMCINHDEDGDCKNCVDIRQREENKKIMMAVANS